MNTYEVNQVWGNEFDTATITVIDTSYDDVYLTYTVEDKTCATNAKVFEVLFPNALAAVPSTISTEVYNSAVVTPGAEET